MKTYRFLLFDADNTLFDFDASEKQAFDEALEECGLPNPEGMYEAYSVYNEECWQKLERGELTKAELVVLRYAMTLERYGIDYDAAHLDEVYEKRLSRLAILLPGARELLAHFYGRVKMYIVTNGLTHVQRGRLSRTDLPKLVNDVFISEEMGSKKPDAAFFRMVAARIPGFELDKTLLIGDSLSSDIRGANNFGCDCVWFNPRRKTDDGGLRITKTVYDFTELRSFLEEHV